VESMAKRSASEGDETSQIEDAANDGTAEDAGERGAGGTGSEMASSGSSAIVEKVKRSAKKSRTEGQKAPATKKKKRDMEADEDEETYSLDQQLEEEEATLPAPECPTNVIRWNGEELVDFLVPLPDNFADEMEKLHPGCLYRFPDLYHDLGKAGKRAFKDLAVVPGFYSADKATARVTVDLSGFGLSGPKELHEHIQKRYGTWRDNVEDPYKDDPEGDEEILLPEKPHDPPRWVKGTHTALKYRGNVLRRDKIWLQTDDPCTEGLRKYWYTGWNWRVSAATRAMSTESGVNELLDQLNAGFTKDASAEEVKALTMNHAIVTHYEGEEFGIQHHSVSPPVCTVLFIAQFHSTFHSTIS
jgi:hypothetical protein